MTRYALNAYEDWPKVRELVTDMAKRNECSIDYGWWMSPIFVMFDDADVQAQFLTICQENRIPYTKV